MARSPMSKTASVVRSSAGTSSGSGSTCGAMPCRSRSRISVRAALVRLPTSRATVRMRGHGTRLNKVTLSTGPSEPMAMPGMCV